MSDPFLQMENFKRNEKIEDSKSKVPQSP